MTDPSPARDHAPQQWAQDRALQVWPTLRTYAGADRQRVRMPLGGLGTGAINLGGRGQLVDLQIGNDPAHGYTPPHLFFALRTASADGAVDTRVLEGQLFDQEYEGAHGSAAPQHGLPRFREAVFRAAFPLARVELADPAVGLDVAVEAFNPLVPGDAEASGHPGFLYRVRLTNTSEVRQSVAVVGNLPNAAGGARGEPPWPGNTYALVEHHPDGTLLDGRNALKDGSPRDGTIALHTPGRRASSARTAWVDRPWGDALAEFWADFADDGALREPAATGSAPRRQAVTGSLVLSGELEPGESGVYEFVVAWHNPYRRAWVNHQFGLGRRASYHVVGNHYATLAEDAAEAAVAFGRALPGLERDTVAFVRSVHGLEMPDAFTDAALSNLAVLKSPTVFRTADGRFYGWEGCNDASGSCHGTCTHVWNYEYATVDLFPELAWSMRETEFVHSLDERGHMAFRAGLPPELEGTGWGYAAADGQMGSILRFYRTWRRTEDHERARALWPAVRRALEFAWVEGGWDPDRDGVMEGCQHTTTDVEYYGPTPLVQSWYLGALAAAAELAAAFDEPDFAAECRRMLRSGAAWTDEHLFNGEYYEQRIIPATSVDAIAPGLRMAHIGEGGSQTLAEPDYQVGRACASDQLAGVTMAALSGLEVPLRPENVATALRSIARYNHRDGFHDHVNPMRSYALGDERGLLNASYPHGTELAYPFPYAPEVWTGLEYTAALGLLTIGETELAVRTVADVRDRHDGRRRNPFDEPECGRHYVRSMASWGLVEAWKRGVADSRHRPG